MPALNQNQQRRPSQEAQDGPTAGRMLPPEVVRTAPFAPSPEDAAELARVLKAALPMIAYARGAFDEAVDSDPSNDADLQACLDVQFAARSVLGRLGQIPATRVEAAGAGLYTRGPYSVHDLTEGERTKFSIVHMGPIAHVGDTGGGPDNCEANAHLLGGSWTMLQALKVIAKAPGIRAWLAQNEPKALAQVEDAIRTAEPRTA